MGTTDGVVSANSHTVAVDNACLGLISKVRVDMIGGTRIMNTCAHRRHIGGRRDLRHGEAPLAEVCTLARGVILEHDLGGSMCGGTNLCHTSGGIALHTRAPMYGTAS